MIINYFDSAKQNEQLLPLVSKLPACMLSSLIVIVMASLSISSGMSTGVLTLAPKIICHSPGAYVTKMRRGKINGGQMLKQNGQKIRKDIFLVMSHIMKVTVLSNHFNCIVKLILIKWLTSSLIPLIDVMLHTIDVHYDIVKFPGIL